MHSSRHIAQYSIGIRSVGIFITSFSLTARSDRHDPIGGFATPGATVSFPPLASLGGNGTTQSPS